MIIRGFKVMNEVDKKKVEQDGIRVLNEWSGQLDWLENNVVFTCERLLSHPSPLRQRPFTRSLTSLDGRDALRGVDA